MNIRLVRVVAAAAVLAVFILSFFLGAAGFRQWLFSLQATPALIVFAGAAIFLVVVIVSTSLWGRWYCSVLCPAGTIQELASAPGRLLGLSTLRYRRPGKTILVLATAALALILGLTAVANLLDPLGWFGRVIAPLAEIASSLSHGAENYAGYFGAAGLGFLLGAALLLAVPLFWGRWFCDRLCPVGAALGALASLAPVKMRLDQKKCVGCRRCEKVCPVSCIDAAAKKLDAERCVLCFACTRVCPGPGLAYGQNESADKRKALAHGAALAAAAAYFAARIWNGKALAQDLVMPPGADNADHYFRTCIGCQSCAAACPVGIIKPSLPGMQPELRFDLGYCQYGCLECGSACPTGALRRLELQEKKTTRLATTAIDTGFCVVHTEKTACGACAEVCPTRALSMETRGDSALPQPVFTSNTA